MGAAASTAREELSAAGTAGDVRAGASPLTCALSDAQVSEFVQSTHFSVEEVVALRVHFDLISTAARDDGLIDRSDFQTALGFTVKESLYVDRIFQLFDTNDDSCISFAEFLQSVSILSSKASADEKLRCTSLELCVRGCLLYYQLVCCCRMLTG